MRPTLYITNWGSKTLHGLGRKITIMARPRHWERGVGCCALLVPNEADLLAVKQGHIGIQEYRNRFEEGLTRPMLSGSSSLAPGGLRAVIYLGAHGMVDVRSGDTLLCACSKDAASRGECHRVWAAAALSAAGWRVILDGKELEA